MYEQSKLKSDIAGAFTFDSNEHDDFWSHRKLMQDAKASAFINKRSHARYSVRMNALLYCGPSFQTVRVKDLSRGGAGIERCGALHVGDRVVIALVSGRKLEGIVKWWLAGNCGVQFDAPLPVDDALFANKQTVQY